MLKTNPHLVNEHMIYEYIFLSMPYFGIKFENLEEFWDLNKQFLCSKNIHEVLGITKNRGKYD